MRFGTRKSGENVLLREVWDGKIWTAHAVTVVEDSPDPTWTMPQLPETIESHA